VSSEPGKEDKLCFGLVIAGVVFFSVVTCYVNWVKMVSLRSTWPYDLAIFDHLAYTHARGARTFYLFFAPWFDVADHIGPSIYRLSQFRLILLFVAQFYRLWASPVVLMLCQSVLIGVGAIPLYWLAARTGKRPKLGLLLAGSYLLHPAICQMGFNDFRTIALGVGPALFALLFHLERRTVPFLVASLVMLSCRQEYVFLLAAFPLVNWRSFSSRRDLLVWALAPVGLAVAWAVIVNIYFLSAFGCPWRVLAERVGGAPTEAVFSKLVERVPIFLRVTLLPGLLALLRPETLVLALPSVIYTDKLFWPAFPMHNLQHLSIALVLVNWGFTTGVCGLWPKIEKRRGHALGARAILVSGALLSFLHFGWGAAKAYLVGGVPRYPSLERISRELPEDATVMAAKGVLPLLSHHHRVLTYQGLPYGAKETPPETELRQMVAELVGICDLVVTQEGVEWINELAVRSGRYLPVQVIEADQTQFVREVEPGIEMPTRRPTRYYAFVAREDAERPTDPDRRLQEILRWDEMADRRRRWADVLVH